MCRRGVPLKLYNGIDRIVIRDIRDIVVLLVDGMILHHSQIVATVDVVDNILAGHGPSIVGIVEVGVV